MTLTGQFPCSNFPFLPSDQKVKIRNSFVGIPELVHSSFSQIISLFPDPATLHKYHLSSSSMTPSPAAASIFFPCLCSVRPLLLLLGRRGRARGDCHAEGQGSSQMVKEDSESSQPREMGKRRQWISKLDTGDTHERSL